MEMMAWTAAVHSFQSRPCLLPILIPLTVTCARLCEPSDPTGDQMGGGCHLGLVVDLFVVLGHAGQSMGGGKEIRGIGGMIELGPLIEFGSI